MADTAKTDAKNVSVGKPNVGGAIFVAPKGTTLPTDATTELASDFKCVGFISEDGVSNEITTDSEEIKAWGGDVVLNPQTSRSEKYKFTMIETNETALKVAFGSDNVTVGPDGKISIKHNGKEREESVYVIETLIGSDKVKRQVIPRGKVSEIGEIVYKDDEVMGYETTVNALLDTAGNTAYEYIAAVSAA